MSDDHRPPIEQVHQLLAGLHEGTEIVGLEPIRGGFWSSAYRYDVGDERFVLRLGRDDEGYRMDQSAVSFTRPGLPIPEVVEIGPAFDGHYAISRRFAGRFLEEVGMDEVDVVGTTLESLLGALRSVNAESANATEASTEWFPMSTPASATWREWISSVTLNDPSSSTAGWSKKLEAQPEAKELFDRCVARLDTLLEVCPERRDLIHGDLLHQNVLLSADASEVNAVFSWKCSVFGDHLYDVALCTFWKPWHPAIAATDPLQRVVAAGVDDDDLTDAALRHHCYELHIGAHHLAWCSWVGEQDNLDGVAARTAEVLDRGPQRLG